MLVMCIGIMLVRVCHRFVAMEMRVSRSRLYGIRVFVLVMRIMDVFMLVIHRYMSVFVNVFLGEMKP